MEKDFDKQKLLSAIKDLMENKNLSDAMAKKDMNGVMSALSPEQAKELKEVLSDKVKLQQIMSSTHAQQIMKALNKDGKR